MLEDNAVEFSDFGTMTFSGVTVDGKPIGDYTGHGYKLSRMENTNVVGVPKPADWVCETTSPLSGKQDFTETWRNLCPEQGIAAGYPGDQVRVSDTSCNTSTGTFTGHPAWVTNMCSLVSPHLAVLCRQVPELVSRLPERQMSRCTGISVGMSRRPGMNGTPSSSSVAIPVR